MDPTPGNLEDEFKFYLKFAKPLILNLTNSNERVRAATWVKKLMSVTDAETGRLRNDYLKLLLFALQRDSLNGPFAVLPNNEPLEPFPDNANLREMVKQMFQYEAETAHSACGEPCHYMVSVSHDLKEYAAAQEIPNFGVHCYYAVSADPISMWSNANPIARLPLPKQSSFNSTGPDATVASSVMSNAGLSVSFSEEAPGRGAANKSLRAHHTLDTSKSGADFFQLHERPEPHEGNEQDLQEFDPLAGQTEIQQNLASMQQTLKALRNNTYLRRTTINGSVIKQSDSVNPHTLSQTIDDLCRGKFQGSQASAKTFHSSDNDLKIVQGHTVVTSDPIDGSIIQLHKSMSIQHAQEPTDSQFTPRPSGMSSTPNDSPPRSSPQKSSPQRSSPQRSSPQRSSPQKSSPQRSSPPSSSPQRSSPQRSSPQRSSPPRSAPPRSSSPRSSPSRSSSPRWSPSRRSTYPAYGEQANRSNVRSSLPGGEIRIDVVTATSSSFSMQYNANDLSEAGMDGSYSPSAPPLDTSDELSYEDESYEDDPNYVADWEDETISDPEGELSDLDGQELLRKRMKERGPNLLPPVVPYYPPNNDGPSPVKLSPASKELQIRYQPQRYDDEMYSDSEPDVRRNPRSGYKGVQYYNRNFGKRHLFGPDPGWQERWKKQTLPNDGSPIPIIEDDDNDLGWLNTRQQRNEFPDTSMTAEELDAYFQEQSGPTYLRQGIPTNAPDSDDYDGTNYTGTYDGAHPDYSPIPKIKEGEKGYDWLDTNQQRNEFPDTANQRDELDKYFQEQSGPTYLRRGIPTTAPDSSDYDETDYTGTYDGSHPNYKKHQELLKQRAAQKKAQEEARLAQQQTKKKPYVKKPYMKAAGTAKKPYMKAPGTAKKPPSAKRPVFQEPTMDDIYEWASIAESISVTSSTLKLETDGLVVEDNVSEVSYTEETDYTSGSNFEEGDEDGQ